MLLNYRSDATHNQLNLKRSVFSKTQDDAKIKQYLRHLEKRSFKIDISSAMRNKAKRNSLLCISLKNNFVNFFFITGKIL